MDDQERRMEIEWMRAEVGYVPREDYEGAQNALPAHKRDDYMDRMMDYADMLLDRFREHGR